MAEPIPLKPAKSSAERSGQVQSLVRALRLLQEVAEAGDGITLTEVANRVGLPVSSAHRLLSTLQQEGFVRFDGERTLWFVGVKAFTVGNAGLVLIPASLQLPFGWALVCSAIYLVVFVAGMHAYARYRARGNPSPAPVPPVPQAGPLAYAIEHAPAGYESD